MAPPERVDTAPTTEVPPFVPVRPVGLVGRVGAAAVLALLWVALLIHNDLTEFSATSLLRVPGEGVLLVAVLLALPTRVARVVAVAAGILLGLVVDLTLVNSGFQRVLDRPVHLLTDGPLIGSALDYVTATSGRAVAVALVAGAGVAVLAVPALMVAGLLRVNRVARRHRTVAATAVALLGVTWLGLAATGTEVGRGRPVAAHRVVDTVVRQQVQFRRDLRDRQAYARQLAAPSMTPSPGAEVLAALRGKDVVLAFVESYGRSALEDPRIAPGVRPALTTAEQDLAAAGFAARSGFLTSPTIGGLSWLPHATLLSGTWVNNQSRYTDLLGSDHDTLVSDFGEAGWRTVAVLPSTEKAWPEGAFYGFDRVYLAGDLDYRGPQFSWSLMPDQYVLSVMQQRELARTARDPVLLELELSSSHKPWAPLPTLVGWSTVGHGSVFDPMPGSGPDPRDFATDYDRQRTEYGRAISYSVSTLASFLATYGTDDTVLVLLGDHQPLPELLPQGVSRDVPISIVARDPAVLDRVTDWGWQPGLQPDPDAPVMRMDQVRARFLGAFGTTVGEVR